MIDDTTDTTSSAPEFDYQQVPVAPETPISTPNDTQEMSTDAKERVAFAAYVKDQGGKIPSNFKDAGSWFDSLKNAQKEYTQSKQEIAELKTKYAKATGDANPDYVPPKTEAPKAEAVVEDVTKGKLRIPDKVEEPVTTTDPSTTASPKDWEAWTVEYATKGTLTQETQDAIKKRTGLPDFVIEQYMEGQKAKIEKAYDKASDVIGGKDHLNKLFVWASKNLSQPEQDNMNQSLASANWEIALLGLNAKYAKMNASNAGSEPPKTATNNKVPSASTQQTMIPYRTKREFSADRGNPRFEHDLKFRAAVEARMMQTDFQKLQP